MNKIAKLSSHSAQIILDTLVKEGINVTVVSAKYKLLKIIHEGSTFFIRGTSFPVNSQPTCMIANNKYLTKKVLKLAKVRIPKTYLVKTALQAKKLINTKNLYPCVLKPTVGAHGNKVYANIETEAELDEIMPHIFPATGTKNVLIEEFIQGKDYRVFVVGDQISAIMERIPAHVIGDGVNTLRRLITIFNNNPLVGVKYEKPMCKIRLNGEVKRNLKKKGVNYKYIPKINEIFFLRQNSNISTGGIGKDATIEAPEIVRATALAATKALGMGVTGVDIIYNKKTNKAYVLELNDQPGIDIHHFPVIGRAQNVALDIINYILNRPTPEMTIAGLEKLPLETPTLEKILPAI